VENGPTRRHFDRIALRFGERAWVCEKEKREIFRRAVSSLVKINRGMKILEVGIGSGAFAETIVLDRDRYFGVDISQAMLEKAKNVIPEANLFRGDGEDLWMIEDNSFNLACCRNVLKHASRPERLLAEMKRVVCSAGTVLVVESCAFDSEDRDFFEKITRITEPTQKPYLLIDDFPRLFSEAGLKDINFVTFGFLDRSNSKYLDTFGISEEQKKTIWDLYCSAPKSVREQRKLAPLPDEPGYQLYLNWVAIVGRK